MSDVAAFFAGIEGKADTTKTTGMTAIFQFNITGDGGGEWYVKIANNQVAVTDGKAENPSIVLTAAAGDWMDIVAGKLNGQTAFLTGRLKIQGDMTLAMKLESLFKLG
jgi:putative sterol carrier protein